MDNKFVHGCLLYLEIKFVPLELAYIELYYSNRNIICWIFAENSTTYVSLLPQVLALGSDGIQAGHTPQVILNPGVHGGLTIVGIFCLEREMT